MPNPHDLMEEDKKLPHRKRALPSQYVRVSLIVLLVMVFGAWLVSLVPW